MHGAKVISRAALGGNRRAYPDDRHGSATHHDWDLRRPQGRQLADGLVELVKIKNDRRALREPDDALKLEAVRMICERIGWRFRIIFKSTLFGPAHVFRNICDVQPWRFTEHTKADVFKVAHRLQGGASMPLAELSEHLGNPFVGAAKLKAMMVGRIVRLDLSRSLNPNTPVSLLSDPRWPARLSRSRLNNCRPRGRPRRKQAASTLSKLERHHRTRPQITPSRTSGILLLG